MATTYDPATDIAPDQTKVASARLRFLTGERAAAEGVRDPVLASWQRSRAHEVAADRVEPTYDADSAHQNPLARGAAPVIRRLGEQLDGQPVSVVLTDQHGLVLDRLTAHKDLERHLDRVCLAPGFVYSEADVGTNGIGTALEVGGPAHVFGHEHYAEHLEELACAAVPIRHPLSGRLVGAIDLTCWRRDAGSLLLTLAKSTADQIGTALGAAASTHDLALLQEFQRVSQHSSRPVIALSGPTALLNDRARSLLDSADQAALFALAEDSLDSLRLGATRVAELTLPSGQLARMHLHPVTDAARAGVVADVQLTTASSAGAASSRPRSPRAPLAGVVGTSPAWRHVCASVEDAFVAGEWLALQGEPGSGKLALLKAVQLRRQPVGRLAVFDGAEADTAWVGRLRDQVRDGTHAVVITHADELGAAALRGVVSTLDEMRRDPEGQHAWAAITLSTDADTDALGPLLRLFPATVDVPPLRLRLEDLEQLVPFFLARIGHGGRLVCSREAMRLLVRLPWPGNVAQLQQMLRHVVQHRRSGTVNVADLPPEAHSTSRRLLSSLEALQRDAIVRALADAGGNKARAAQALGMSRATIYRKIHDYGIVSPR